MTEGFVYLIVGFGIAGLIYYRLAQVPNPPNPNMVCPHCATKGTVTVTQVRRKQGISGGKATGALMTGGLSMFATGLSRKQAARHCVCGNCSMEWDVP